MNEKKTDGEHHERIGLLFVQDDIWLQNAFSSFFEKNGYDIKIVNTAEEALRWIDSEIADVVITDRVLPGINGIEFMKRIQDLDAVKIMISGISSPEFIDRISERGVDLFYRKPFNMHVLEQNMKSLLSSRSRASGENRKVL